jgi:indolepyruvate ferredoxin oxidoreductase, beta subunit
MPGKRHLTFKKIGDDMDITKLIIVAVGGQGNLLASKVLGEGAIRQGVPVRMSEIHGMAQRGGVVESSVLFGDVHSTIISDGEADVLLGFEPSETLRAMNKSNRNTIVITNLHPLPPFTVAIGKGKYPDLDSAFKVVKEKCRRLIALDGMKLAQAAGTVMSLNMVMLGALAQTDSIPLTVKTLEDTIRHSTKKAFADINLKAFSLGYDAAARAV